MEAAHRPAELLQSVSKCPASDVLLELVKEVEHDDRQPQVLAYGQRYPVFIANVCANIEIAMHQALDERDVPRIQLLARTYAAAAGPEFYTVRAWCSDHTTPAKHTSPAHRLLEASVLAWALHRWPLGMPDGPQRAPSGVSVSSSAAASPAHGAAAASRHQGSAASPTHAPVHTRHRAALSMIRRYDEWVALTAHTNEDVYVSVYNVCCSFNATPGALPSYQLLQMLTTHIVHHLETHAAAATKSGRHTAGSRSPPPAAPQAFVATAEHNRDRGHKRAASLHSPLREHHGKDGQPCYRIGVEDSLEARGREAPSAETAASARASRRHLRQSNADAAAATAGGNSSSVNAPRARTAERRGSHAEHDELGTIERECLLMLRCLYVCLDKVEPASVRAAAVAGRVFKHVSVLTAKALRQHAHPHLFALVWSGILMRDLAVTNAAACALTSADIRVLVRTLTVMAANSVACSCRGSDTADNLAVLFFGFAQLPFNEHTSEAVLEFYADSAPETALVAYAAHRTVLHTHAQAATLLRRVSECLQHLANVTVGTPDVDVSTTGKRLQLVLYLSKMALQSAPTDRERQTLFVRVGAACASLHQLGGGCDWVVHEWAHGAHACRFDVDSPHAADVVAVVARMLRTPLAAWVLPVVWTTPAAWWAELRPVLQALLDAEVSAVDTMRAATLKLRANTALGWLTTQTPPAAHFVSVLLQQSGADWTAFLGLPESLTPAAFEHMLIDGVVEGASQLEPADHGDNCPQRSQGVTGSRSRQPRTHDSCADSRVKGLGLAPGLLCNAMYAMAATDASCCITFVEDLITYVNQLSSSTQPEMLHRFIDAVLEGFASCFDLAVHTAREGRSSRADNDDRAQGRRGSTGSTATATATATTAGSHRAGPRTNASRVHTRAQQRACQGATNVTVGMAADSLLVFGTRVHKPTGRAGQSHAVVELCEVLPTLPAPHKGSSAGGAAAAAPAAAAAAADAHSQSLDAHQHAGRPEDALLATAEIQTVLSSTNDVQLLSSEQLLQALVDQFCMYSTSHVLRHAATLVRSIASVLSLRPSEPVTDVLCSAALRLSARVAHVFTETQQFVEAMVQCAYAGLRFPRSAKAAQQFVELLAHHDLPPSLAPQSILRTMNLSIAAVSQLLYRDMSVHSCDSMGDVKTGAFAPVHSGDSGAHFASLLGAKSQYRAACAADGTCYGEASQSSCRDGSHVTAAQQDHVRRTQGSRRYERRDTSVRQDIGSSPERPPVLGGRHHASQQHILQLTDTETSPATMDCSVGSGSPVGMHGDGEPGVSAPPLGPQPQGSDSSGDDHATSTTSNSAHTTVLTSPNENVTVHYTLQLPALLGTASIGRESVSAVYRSRLCAAVAVLNVAGTPECMRLAAKPFIAKHAPALEADALALLSLPQDVVSMHSSLRRAAHVRFAAWMCRWIIGPGCDTLRHLLLQIANRALAGCKDVIEIAILLTAVHELGVPLSGYAPFLRAVYAASQHPVYAGSISTQRLFRYIITDANIAEERAHQMQPSGTAERLGHEEALRRQQRQRRRRHVMH